MSSFSTKSIRPWRGFRRRAEPAKKKHKIMRWIFLVAIFIFGLLLFTYVLPQVTVIIIPATKNVEKEFAVQLTADKSKVDEEHNIFGAEVAEASEEAQAKFTATGQKDKGNKASGAAIFYNYTGRPLSLTLATDLINDSGIIFVVKKESIIPSAKVDETGNVVAGEINLEIEAKEAGEKGNVGPGRLSIAGLDAGKQQKIYGEIKNNLNGGTSQMATVVSQDDLDKAQRELTEQLTPKVKEKISQAVGEKMYISDNLISFDGSEVTKTVEVDNEATDFEMNLKLKARALVYDNKKLRIFLRNKILAGLSKNQTIAETEFGNLDIQVEKLDITFGLADLKIKAVFPVAENVDLAAIKKNILGKKEKDARRYVLSLPNIKDVRLVFSLNLRNDIPNHEDRVKVILSNE